VEERFFLLLAGFDPLFDEFRQSPQAKHSQRKSKAPPSFAKIAKEAWGPASLFALLIFLSQKAFFKNLSI
jgi:hypothetical protein